MPRVLKVYRTAIGFHDAYVAAPSQKAALEAWGTDKDLFARKAAEVVTDPALTAAPLKRPGEVIRVVRGSAAEHVKALGKTSHAAAKPTAPATKTREAKPRRPPKPSDEAVKLAEQGLRAAEKRAAERLAELSQREKALAAERRRVERELKAECERHEARVRRATAAYDAALADWRDAKE